MENKQSEAATQEVKEVVMIKEIFKYLESESKRTALIVKLDNQLDSSTEHRTGI